MAQPNRGIVSELIHDRSSVFELFLVAILLALSVNLVASTLPLLFPLPPILILAFGLILGFAIIAYSTFRFFGKTRKSWTFKGFFQYNREANQLIPTPRYEFGESLAKYMRAAFVENPALKDLWDRYPLRSNENASEESNEEREVFLRSFKLITEATEYFVLRTLCLHLSDYFQRLRYHEKMLTTFLKNNIPDVLLSNHFLELFSRPMDERTHFLENLGGMDYEHIIHAMTPSGAIYDKFELILPRHSKVKRLSDNTLEIATERFVLRIIVLFDGSNTFVPFEFHEYYLGLNLPEPGLVDDFKVDVKIDVSFKLAAFLSPGGWDYYFWVDSFFEKLSEDFEEEAFFQSIGWKQALTVIRFLASQYPQRRKSPGLK